MRRSQEPEKIQDKFRSVIRNNMRQNTIFGEDTGAK